MFATAVAVWVCGCAGHRAVHSMKYGYLQLAWALCPLPLPVHLEVLCVGINCSTRLEAHLQWIVWRVLLSASHLHTGLLRIRALVCSFLLVGVKDALQVLLGTHVSLR